MSTPTTTTKTTRCGDRQPVDFSEPRGATYRCTLPAGHTGDHVDQKHPLHPSWVSLPPHTADTQA